MKRTDMPEYTLLIYVRKRMRLVHEAGSLTKQEREVCLYHLGEVAAYIEARMGRKMGGNVRVRGRSKPFTHEGGRMVPL